MGIRSRETSGWQSPTVGGVHWAVGWGSPEKKLGTAVEESGSTKVDLDQKALQGEPIECGVSGEAE